ncbi:DUF2306 domain-containing protein [Streptomyces sp. NPDC086766]|uniref:DUF2306 domain-containing protein n=1 Tax=Streptomyces sp. NPDC086766 TaxID=3365754 RepID=UPI00381820D8
MSQTLNTSEPAGPESPDIESAQPNSRRRNIWTLVFSLIALWFINHSLPVYLSLDPNQARIPHLRRDIPWHYPLLVAHVFSGTVALVTVCLQVWPWLRRNHPAVHRWSGRIYVFAGALPSGLLALAIMPFSAGPAGNTVAAVAWLATTVAGLRTARQRRYREHRRWMAYSFALTMQIIWGRVLLIYVLPLFEYNFADPAKLNLALETATWIGFVINLLLAQWWLERTARDTTRR